LGLTRFLRRLEKRYRNAEGLPITLSVDLFFSFRSPYSYLALPKTMKVAADYDVTVNLRPVYPLAVRVPGFFKRTNPQFLPYVALDSSRVAQRENIPYRFPRPDPIVQDLATLEVAEHQPYIHRLTRLGALAQAEGRSLEFVHAIAPVCGDSSVAGWNRAIISPGRRPSPASTSPRWTPLSSPMPIATSGSSPAMSRTTPHQAIGACPLSCSKTNRSSARIASIS
jgi:hypothetical protein